MLEAADAWPMNFGFLGKGNASTAAAGRTDSGRRVRAQAARGLGHHAGRHRYLPARRRSVRRAGGHSHRHDQRSRLRRRYHRGHRRPHHPHLSHRGRGRRPRARHHPHRRAAERSAVVHQSDAAVHRQHHRRASGHADGVPSSESAGAGRRGLRREPHPARRRSRRGYSARSGRLQHDLERLAGHGPHRRSGDAHLADRAQDEGAARAALPEDSARNDNFRVKRYVAKYTINPAITHGIAASKSARSSRASWRIWCCGSRPSSA